MQGLMLGLLSLVDRFFVENPEKNFQISHLDQASMMMRAA